MTIGYLKKLVLDAISKHGNPLQFDYKITCKGNNGNEVLPISAVMVRGDRVIEIFGNAVRGDLNYETDPNIDAQYFVKWLKTNGRYDDSFHAYMKTDWREDPVGNVEAVRKDSRTIVLVYEFDDGNKLEMPECIEEEFGVDDGLGLNKGNESKPIGAGLFGGEEDRTQNLWAAICNPENSNALDDNAYIAPRFVYVATNSTIKYHEDDNNPEEHYDTWQDVLDCEIDQITILPVCDTEMELKSYFKMADSDIAKLKTVLWNTPAKYANLTIDYDFNAYFETPYTGPMYGPNAAVSPPDPHVERVTGSNENDEIPIVVVDELLFKKIKDFKKNFEINPELAKRIKFELNTNTKFF